MKTQMWVLTSLFLARLLTLIQVHSQTIESQTRNKSVATRHHPNTPISGEE
jgi:hypothetical protein